MLDLEKDDLEIIEKTHAMIERQVGHVARLIDDLLDLSRIRQGRVELRLSRVDLGTVVGHALETCRPVVERRGHELTTSLPEGPIPIRADVDRLSQVLTNLLNNAAKFTERGGRISLSVEREGGEALIRVRDTGVGIPAHMLPRIFDMYTQVDSTRDRSQGGLGIGLKLVRGLVEMHGGVVESHSDGPGHGSEFVVRIPLCLD